MPPIYPHDYYRILYFQRPDPRFVFPAEPKITSEDQAVADNENVLLTETGETLITEDGHRLLLE